MRLTLPSGHYTLEQMLKFSLERVLCPVCGLGCSNLVCTLHMERERSLFIFKVKGQISRSLGRYKEFWSLDPCGQDIARTMQSRLLKRSMYTSYGSGRSLLNSKVTVQGHWTFIRNFLTWIIVGKIYQEQCSLRAQT